MCSRVPEITLIMANLLFSIYKCYLSEFINFMDILQEFYNKLESVSFCLFVK